VLTGYVPTGVVVALTLADGVALLPPLAKTPVVTRVPRIRALRIVFLTIVIFRPPMNVFIITILKFQFVKQKMQTIAYFFITHLRTGKKKIIELRE
jgi:hypothetical protein